MNFYLSFSVIFPLCVYMVIGIVSKKLQLLDDHTIAQVNAFCFKFLFSLAMFNNLMSAGDALGSDSLKAAFGFVGVFFVFLGILIILAQLLVKQQNRKGAFIQGGFRGNSILFAIPLVEAISGKEALAFASICVAILVPLYNVTAVLVLEYFRGGKPNLKSMVRSIVTNPIILGAVAGFLVLLSGITLPDFVNKPISALASMTTPLALIMLGASLKFSDFRRDALPLFEVCFLRLILSPIVFLCYARLFGLSPQMTTVALALSCVPTAVSSYTMTQQMGGDGPFAAEIVAATSVLSMITVFLWVSVLSGLGWLG